MITIITELSKYIIIILGIIYTLTCFTIFRPVNADRQAKLLNRQLGNIYVLHFFCYLVLFLRTENYQLVFFYGAQALFFLLTQFLYAKLYPKASRLITNNMCFLLAIGFIVLTRLNFNQALKQFIIVCVCILIFAPVPFLILKGFKLSRFCWIYAGIGFVLLCSVFVIGSTVYGATNWVKIGPITFQPSEFVKIVFVMFVASMFTKSLEFKNIVVTTLIAATFVILLVLERDLGGALLFFVVYLVMLFVATGNVFYFLGGLASGSAAAFIAYKLFSHVQTRVAAWLNPWPIITGGGGQIAQSLFAIGTGGWMGLGLGKGMPYLIPVVVSDFVFSAIAEELGGIFALCLILVCISCFVLFTDISMRNKRIFPKLLAVGFGACYIFQVFLNIGGVAKFIPSTGVTLPLVSYGGSSIASSLILFNMIQGLYMVVRAEEGYHIEKTAKD